MTQDEIYEMVRQSDLGFLLGDNWMMQHEFEAFAKLVAAKAIAELESQEPVAWVCCGSSEKHDIDFYEDDVNALPVGTMLYTHPPQRTWVGLDHHDKKKFSSWLDHKSDDEVFTAIEAKLKELNT
jgi:hypothetical protein